MTQDITVANVTKERNPAQEHPSRIVVVDDDDSYLDLMREFLQTEGYEILPHREWGSAHQYIRDVRPHLIILDLVMGRETRGWGILDRLRGDPDTAAIPVIVCSADVPSLNAHEDSYARYGVRPLSKPFDLDYLLVMIAESIGRSAASAR